MNTYTKTILEELAKTENELLEADTALAAAETRRGIAMVTFATIRDHARDILGRPPFTLTEEEWEQRKNPKSGRFRYARMRPSEAAIDVLKEFGPLRQDNLIEKMLQGGLEVRDGRAINAALMNHKRIVREKENGKLSLRPEVEEAQQKEDELI